MIAQTIETENRTQERAKGQRGLIALITLIAFLLRAYRLDFQSYWIDEGLTIRYANLSLPELWESLQTVRAVPPLYHGLTIYWVQLLGDGEYALRFFSLIFSVLAVPLTYRLGKALGNGQIGLIAATLMAFVPYQIWHAQDARNYSMLTALSIMSMWGFVNLWRPGGWRWWLLYVIGTEAALMTHYHALVVIGIQGLFFLLTWRRHWRHYLPWAGTLAVILLPYVLWMIFGSQLWQGDHWLPYVDLWESYLRSGLAYSVGELVPRQTALILTLIFVLFYGVGLAVASRRQWRQWSGMDMVAFLVVYTFAANLAVWVYSALQTPVYLERYLIAVQVGYLLTIAFGIWGVAQLITNAGRKLKRSHQYRGLLNNVAILVGILALAAPSGWVLYHHYLDPTYAKPDWRGVVETIDQFSLPGDAILMTGDGGELLFDFYYQGDLPVYDTFNTPVPPPDEARQELADLAAQHDRLWYTPYGVEIDATLEGWLAENSYPAWHAWLGRKRLALYDLSPTAQQAMTRSETLFPIAEGQGLQLTSVALSTDPVMAGDLLALQLDWLTTTNLDRDYTLSLRLLNSEGDLFAQSDWPPLPASGMGTAAWPVDTPVTDRRSLWIPYDVPPGGYTLQGVVYDSVSGQTLGAPTVLGQVTTTAAQTTPPLAAFTRPNPIEVALGPLTLVGYAAPDSIQPGQMMWLWLHWQANEPLASDLSLRIQLNSQDTMVSTDFSLAESAGDLGTWQPGQLRRAVYHLPTTPQLLGADGQISLSLFDEGGAALAAAPLTTLALDNRPHNFDLPVLAEALNVAFGDPKKLLLLGSDVPAAVGDQPTLPITLYWKAEAEMMENYTVFVQLLDGANQVVAQVDEPPLAGAAPTNTWLSGEVLTDQKTLSLPDLPTGEYQLIVGMYDPTTMARLPINLNQDFVRLTTVVVE